MKTKKAKVFSFIGLLTILFILMVIGVVAVHFNWGDNGPFVCFFCGALAAKVVDWFGKMSDEEEKEVTDGK